MTFMVNGNILELRKTAYENNNRIALIAVEKETGEEFGTLTANFPEVQIAPDEFVIKNWTENEELAKAAFKTGIFVDTGECVANGFVKAPIWKFKDQSTLEHMAEIED